jgi:hypothetical protein
MSAGLVDKLGSCSNIVATAQLGWVTIFMSVANASRHIEFDA